MNDIKNIFERLTAQNIKWSVWHVGDNKHVFLLTDAPDNGLMGVSYEEGIAYFESMLTFAVEREREG